MFSNNKVKFKFFNIFDSAEVQIRSSEQVKDTTFQKNRKL